MVPAVRVNVAATPAKGLWSPCYWLLIIHFDLEAEIFNHTPDFWGWLAGCCEVAVYEDGVGWVEGQRLEASQIMFAASCNAKFGAWVEETEEAECFQTALRGQVVAVL